MLGSHSAAGAGTRCKLIQRGAHSKGLNREDLCKGLHMHLALQQQQPDSFSCRSRTWLQQVHSDRPLSTQLI